MFYINFKIIICFISLLLTTLTWQFIWALGVADVRNKFASTIQEDNTSTSISNKNRMFCPREQKDVKEIRRVCCRRMCERLQTCAILLSSWALTNGGWSWQRTCEGRLASGGARGSQMIAPTNPVHHFLQCDEGASIDAEPDEAVWRQNTLSIPIQHPARTVVRLVIKFKINQLTQN